MSKPHYLIRIVPGGRLSVRGMLCTYACISKLLTLCLSSLPFPHRTRHLKPGGWIEVQDLELAAYSDDGTLPEGAPLKRLFEVIRAVKDIGEHYGAPNHDHLPLIGGLLREVGFTRVEKKMDRKIPWSPWAHHDPRELYWGKCMSVSVDTFLPFAPKLLADGGVDPSEIDGIIEGSRRTVRDDRIHPYSKFIVWIAQKPLSE